MNLFLSVLRRNYEMAFLCFILLWFQSDIRGWCSVLWPLSNKRIAQLEQSVISETALLNFFQHSAKEIPVVSTWSLLLIVSQA